MKTNKIVYWVSTFLIVLIGASSGFMYFTNPMVMNGFKHLGFPDYFRVELGIAKLIGAVILLIPQIPVRYKEWAYVGFGITFISATIAHWEAGDGLSKAAAPLIALILLIVSYIFYYKSGKAAKIIA